MSAEQIAPKKQKKAKWLRELERQSWQAELIVSGLAIIGSLQLPGLIDSLENYLLVSVSDDILNVFRFISIYLYVAATALIVNFILHFILRALWIGMIGLSSVYPDGIVLYPRYFSEAYMRLLMKEFPDLNGFNQRLDNLCSIIFSICSLFVLGLISTCLFILTIILFSSLVHYFLPAIEYMNIFITFIIILSIPTILLSFMNIKWIKNQAWAAPLQLKLYKAQGYMFYNIFFEPFNYIYYTFFTNNKGNSFWFVSILYFFIVFGSATPFLVRSNGIFYEKDNFFNSTSSTHQSFAHYYEDQKTDDSRILFPTISSEFIEGSFLKLFIPILKREQEAFYEVCPKYKDDESISRFVNRDKRTDYYIKGYQKFWQFQVGDSTFNDLKVRYHRHANANERGLIIYIPTKDFQEGENTLVLSNEYKDKDDKKRKIIIPFVFTPK